MRILIDWFIDMRRRGRTVTSAGQRATILYFSVNNVSINHSCLFHIRSHTTIWDGPKVRPLRLTAGIFNAPDDCFLCILKPLRLKMSVYSIFSKFIILNFGFLYECIASRSANAHWESKCQYRRNAVKSTKFKYFPWKLTFRRTNWWNRNSRMRIISLENVYFGWNITFLCRFALFWELEQQM